MALISHIKRDIRLQWRHGIYGAYGFITFVYWAFLNLWPAELTDKLAPLILFTDPSVLGAFFMGGILLLEHEHDTIRPLLLTPSPPSYYMVSKILSLALLAVGASFSIACLSLGIPKNPLLFLTTTALIACFFNQVGFLIAHLVEGVSAYFMLSILIMTPLLFPTAEPLGLISWPPMLYTPTGAGFLLLVKSLGEGATLNTSTWPYLLVLCFSNILIMPLAWGIFCRHHFGQFGGCP